MGDTTDMPLDAFLHRYTDVAGLVLGHLTLSEKAVLAVASRKCRRAVNQGTSEFVRFGPRVSLSVSRLRWHGPLEAAPIRTHLPTAIKGMWQLLHNGERTLAFYDRPSSSWRYERLDREPFVVGHAPLASVPYYTPGLPRGQVQLVFLANRRNNHRDNSHLLVQAPRPFLITRMNKPKDAPMAMGLEPPAPPLSEVHWVQGDTDSPTLARVYDMVVRRSWRDENFPNGHMVYTSHAWCAEINTLVLSREGRMWCIVLDPQYERVVFKAFLPPLPSIAYRGASMAYNHANGLLYIVGGCNRGNRKMDAVRSFPLWHYVAYGVSLGENSMSACMRTLQSQLGALQHHFAEQNHGLELSPDFMCNVPLGYTTQMVVNALNDSPYMEQCYMTGKDFEYDRPFALMIARQDAAVRFVDKGRCMMVAGGISVNRQRVAQIEFYDLRANARLKIRCMAPDNAEM